MDPTAVRLVPSRPTRQADDSAHGPWHLCPQVDAINVGFAIFIFLWLGFREPHRLAFHAPIAYSAVLALLGTVLALLWLARDWCGCATSRRHAACPVLLHALFGFAALLAPAWGPRACGPCGRLCGARQAAAAGCALSRKLSAGVLRLCGARCRLVQYREAIAKALCLLYCAFNALVAFPRLLASLPAGGGLNLALQLRYSNAQPLLTCNIVTMVCGVPACRGAVRACVISGCPGWRRRSC